MATRNGVSSLVEAVIRILPLCQNFLLIAVDRRRDVGRIGVFRRNPVSRRDLFDHVAGRQPRSLVAVIVDHDPEQFAILESKDRLAQTLTIIG